MNWFKDIKVILFDLDGTLYQDYTFLGRYIRHLLEGRLPDSEIEQKVEEAYSILEGNHPVKFGYFYNRATNKVYAHQDLKLTKAYLWDGKEDEDINEDSDQLFYIGDPWGIAYLYINQYGLEGQTSRQAFEKVRQEMLCEPNKIYRHHLLFDSIADLNVEKKIFLTNTPGPTGPGFVKHLKIEDVFDDYVYDAGKPDGIEDYVNQLIDEGYQAEEILSIGDNPWNDLYPVKKSGGKTCVISKFAHSDSTVWDMSVKTIEELAEFLSSQRAGLKSLPSAKN